MRYSMTIGRPAPGPLVPLYCLFFFPGGPWCPVCRDLDPLATLYRMTGYGRRAIVETCGPWRSPFKPRSHQVFWNAIRSRLVASAGAPGCTSRCQICSSAWRSRVRSSDNRESSDASGASDWPQAACKIIVLSL